MIVVAPALMSGRDVARELLRDVSDDVIELTVEFGPEQYPTTSFMDELVHQTLVEHDLRRLTLRAAAADTAELATEAAKRHSVTDKLVFAD